MAHIPSPGPFRPDRPAFRAARWLALLAIALGTALSAPQVQAHGDLDEQIKRATAQIVQHPKDAALYLKRGELHRIHRDWAAAKRDYDKAARLGPELDVVHFCRGRMWLEAGEPAKALKPLNTYLARHPDDEGARVARARALAKLGKARAAAEDFTRAIAGAPEPQPDYFLERAQALAAAGEIDEALRGLDEGVRQLGPLVTLQLPAIDLELKRKAHDRALERLDTLAAQSPRKETWLERRGQILVQAGREQEAAAAFSAALAEIESLPARLRQTTAMTELTDRLNVALEALRGRGAELAHPKQ